MPSIVVIAVCSVVLAAVAVAFDARAAVAAPELIAPGHFDAVVATESGALAIAGETIHVLDSAGHSKRIVTRAGESPPARARRHLAPDELTAAPGLNGDDDFGDPIDDDEIDDPDDPVVDDETRTGAWDLEEGERKRSPRSGNPAAVTARSVVVAAFGSRAWIARGDGLWRVDLEDGSMTRALGSRAPARGTDADAIALGGQRGQILVMAAHRRIWRSADGGDTFEPIGSPADARAHKVVVSASGAIYAIDGGELRHIDATTASEGGAAPAAWQVEPTGAAAPVDVAACGEDVVILRGGALFDVSVGGVGAVGGAIGPGGRAANGGDTDSVADAGANIEPRKHEARIGAVPDGAEQLVCGGGLWALLGSGLWTSDDRGRSWTARLDSPPGVINAIAASGAALWIAASSGLWRLPRRAPTEVTRWRWTEPGAHAIRSQQRQPSELWRRLASALPRLDLSLTLAQTAARRDVRALVVLTFALDGHAWDRARERATVEILRRARITGEAATATTATTPSTTPVDPITTDEQRQIARVLEDQL